MLSYREQVTRGEYKIKPKRLKPVLKGKVQYKANSRGVRVGYNARYNKFRSDPKLNLTSYMEYGGTITGFVSTNLGEMLKHPDSIIVRLQGRRLTGKLFVVKKGDHAFIFRAYRSRKRKPLLVAVALPKATYRPGQMEFFKRFNLTFDDIVDEQLENYMRKLLPAI